MCRFMKRAAFQSFVPKLRPISKSFMSILTSCPSAVIIIMLKRRASALVASMTLSGSSELPRLLLILRPWPSRTVPWMCTREKGTSPMNLSPAIIMRATQKKSMSGAFTRSLVG